MAEEAEGLRKRDVPTYDAITGISSQQASATGVEKQAGTERLQVKKEIGLTSGILITCGMMIGVGVFISPNLVLAASNNSVGVNLVIWLSGGIVAILSALCYSELVMSIPESGSDYTYIKYAFGETLAFLLPWMNCFLPTSDSLTALAFGQYAVQPLFPACQVPQHAVKLLATCMILIVTAINAASVKLAVRVQGVITSAKFLTIAFVVGGGFYYLTQDSSIAEKTFSNLFDPKQMSGIVFATASNAIYQVMWTYQGWSALSYVTEEVDHPRTIVIASVVAVLIVTISFLTINGAYLVVLTPMEMANTKTVALSFSDKILGNGSWVVSVMVCVVTFGSYNCSVLASARTLYAAARNGHLPQIFGMLHIHRTSPFTALWLNAIPTVVLVWIGDIQSLLDTFGFVSWTFFTFAHAAVLVLRHKRPELARPFKVPTVIPVFMTVISFFFVVVPFLSNLHFLYFYSIIFFAAGILVHHVFVRRKVRVPGIEPATLCLQKLLAVAPEDAEHKD